MRDDYTMKDRVERGSDLFYLCGKCGEAMRPVLDLTFIQFDLRKILSVGMCFALVGLEATPAFARNNDLTYQPPIRFQYSPQVKVFDVTTKPVVKLETTPSVQKPSLIQSVSSVIKGIGASVVAVFKKIGDGIVNLAQNIC